MSALSATELETTWLDPARQRRIAWASLLMIVASMSIATARLFDAPPLQSANDRSRWSTVWSLVERNTYQIDEIRKRRGWDTIDLVRHNGHFYSSKPPLLPRLVAEVYRGIRFVTGWTLTDNTAAVTRIVLFLINILPMGFAHWCFARMLRRHAPDPFVNLFVMAGASFATMLAPFLTVFNNHTVAASCFFISLPLAISIVVEERRQSWRFAACGLLTAFGVCNELPAALFGVAAFLLLLQADWRKTAMWFVPAALIPLIAFFITNYNVTGGWKPFYAYYGTEKYVFIYEGVPSYWMEPKGIDQARDSTLTYLWHCTVGHHGIFSLSPIYLITLFSWILPWRMWRSPLRVFHLLSLLLSVVTLGFYLTKTENYNYGGVSVALRWMLWLTPFWLVSMLPVLNRWREWTAVRALLLILLAVSVFSAWYPSDGPWTKNWIYAWMEREKWIDYSNPAPQFAKKHYSWIGQLPSGELQPDYWIIFAAAGAAGDWEEIRLADAGPDGDSRRKLSVRRTRDGQVLVDKTYLLDADAFAAGKPVEEFLLSLASGDQQLTENDREFFRGMPRRMQYVGSRVRYEKTSLRTDAFRCHVGYTYVTVDEGEGTPRQVIRDVWYTEEVPFGVLKWEDRIQNAKTRALLMRRHWLPTEVGKFLPRKERSPF